jgi:hypothetical protein
MYLCPLKKKQPLLLLFVKQHQSPQHFTLLGYVLPPKIHYISHKLRIKTNKIQRFRKAVAKYEITIHST